MGCCKFFMLLLIIITQTLFLIRTSGDVCSTKNCLSTAATLLENMNLAADLCEDFYEYTCGNFQNTVNLSHEKPFTAVLSERYAEYLDEIKGIYRDIYPTLLLETRKTLSEPDSMQKAKDFYTVCMNSTVEDEIQDIKHYIEESLGSLPLIMKDEWNEKHFNWQEMLIYLTKNGFKNTGLFEIKIESTLSNKTTRPIEYRPSALHTLLGNYSVTFDEANTKLSEILQKLLSTFAVPVTDEENFSFQIQQIISFMHVYMKLPTYSRLVTLHTIEELQVYIPEFNWIKLFQKIVTSHFELDIEVYVEGIDWLKSVITAVHSTTKRTIANYLVLNTITSLYVNQELSISLQSRIRDVIQNVTDTSSPYEPVAPKKSNFCVEHSGHISNAVKAIHYKKYLFHWKRDSVQQMITQIHKTFFALLHRSYTNEGFVTNVEQSLEYRNNRWDIPLEIAIDEKYLDDIYLDAEYERKWLVLNLVTSNDNAQNSNLPADWKSFFRNVLAIKRFQVVQSIAGIKPSELQQPDVKYVGSLKHGLQKIVVPGCLLNGIVYAVDRNSGFNFGTLGTKIAGGLITYLRPLIELYYHQRSPSFSADPISETPDYMFEIYSSYVKKLPEFQQWPKWKEQDLYKTVLFESITVKLAYRAYGDWLLEHDDDDSQLPGIEFNSTQLFWLGYTTLHCITHEENFTKFLPFYTPYENKLSVLSLFYLIPDFNNMFDCKK